MNANRISCWLIALLGALSVADVPSAWSQDNRPKVGDLVEYVSGLGPTLAEIVAEPDVTGYVMVLLPTGKSVPVHPSKLRLIQRAGTPDAKVQVGAEASWSSGGVAERGQVTKVNGKWCQVRSGNATTIGWVECDTLRTGAESAAAATPKERPAAPAAALPPLLGKWENADGSAKLEFQKAGKCWISMGPLSSKCTYKPNATGVVVTLDGEDLTLALTAEDDGSLSGDPDAMIPMRFTRK